ncbi:hypothetical protein GGR51DRAFT_574691 [Nemania sp. FL0031]|nr:hypothetical protein GGR51DRAFT_574691 [Nemania sp. FL0031]
MAEPYESPHPNIVGASDELEGPVHDRGLVAVMQEIKNLQQRLWQLEREAWPMLVGEAPEANWGHPGGKLGLEQENETRKGKRRRKAELRGSRREHRYDKASAKYDDDEESAYDLSLLNLGEPDPGSSAKNKIDILEETEEPEKSGDKAPLDTVDTAAENIKETIIPEARSELTRVSWDQFVELRGLGEGSSAAMDVLIGEPIIEFNPGVYGQRPLPSPQKNETDQLQEQRAAPGLDLEPGEGPMPERLRINSRHLIQVLSQDYASYHLAPPGDSSVILLRPFRMLDFYNKRIRETYEKLKSKFENGHIDTSPNTDSTSVGAVNQNSKDGDHDDEGNDLIISLDSPIGFNHLKVLVEFIDNDLQNRINYLNTNRCQKVAFSDLWYLFQPGGLVISNNGKQAYRILSMNSIGHKTIDPKSKYKKHSREEASITVKCVYIDFDGKRLGPVSKTFHIPRFGGERAVTSLIIYPLRFYPYQKDSVDDSASIPEDTFREHLMKRGKFFLQVAAVRLAAIQPMYYAGPAIHTQDEIESQVVVDFEAAFAVEEHSVRDWKPNLETLIGSEENELDPKQKICTAGCCRNERVHDDSYVEEKRNERFMHSLLPSSSEEMPSVAIIPRPLDTEAPENGLAEEDFVIMSYRVFGFVLRNRKWAQLDLTHLSEIEPFEVKTSGDENSNENSKEHRLAFDELVLPDGHKDMILSLVTQHFRNKESLHNEQADIVRGKGKGLIMLLHGAPGVGKTTTAEGVAERFRKPLFQLTCGDLGITARDVESTLERNFALASRWGCILLLDEADVFLAQRTKEDFQRNGLVAVFLRVLEYYAGILFLTTNRVGDFDEAFASRIHISLYYPELGDKETREVFKLNLRLIRERFRGKSRGFNAENEEIAIFAREYWHDHPFDHWNGRQVRNACQTALALAEYEALGNGESTVELKPVELKVSHFEKVAAAYLAFSNHLKDIYGTHAARRAKEAGLRAMWVNGKGELMGNIGPKEAGILKAEKAERKFRIYRSGARGREVPPSHGQQHQTMPSSDQASLSQGGYGSFQDGNRQAPNYQQFVQPRPMGPQGHSSVPSMSQQFNNPNQQPQGQMVPPGPQPMQDWGSYDGAYGHGSQHLDGGGHMPYAQQQQFRQDPRYLTSPQGGSPAQQQQSRQPSPSGQVPGYGEPRSETDVGESQYRT